MLFTDKTCRTERLTEAAVGKLLASDSVERYQDCGWHCATGYKDGRVQVMVHAYSKAELDLALGFGIETKPTPLSLAPHRLPNHGTSLEIRGFLSRLKRNESGAKYSIAPERPR
jgi:hypothetical protein